MADYEFLGPDTIAGYLRSRPKLAARIDPDDLVDIREIGDGNLNLVFLLKDGSGRGLCLKQALPYVRLVGEGWPMTPERAAHEAHSLAAHRALAPGLVVDLIDFDPTLHVIGMEDLSDHQVWRAALVAGEQHDGAAEGMGRLVGAVAFGTSVFGMERQALADSQAQAINPQLCEITEDLVFTEPSVPGDRNSCLPANEPDAAELSADRGFVAAMGEAKWRFMTHGEALVHGDLHTGSVMVRKPEGSDRVDSVKAFDSEFAFYGPVAFDLGALWANYAIAAARAYALSEDERARWCLSLAGRTWAAFEAEFLARWPQRRDPRLWDDEFASGRLATWREETWLFAAAKMSRRIVGVAKTKDIESLPENLREGAARGILRLARAAVRERTVDFSPERFAELAAATLVANRTN